MRLKLSELNPKLLERVNKAIAKEDKKTVDRLVQVKKKQPNKTEAKYNLEILGGKGRYEVITLRLPGGTRYTPDWMTVDEHGIMTLHECKGGYRLHSQGSAAVRFRECAVAFPEFRFVWAMWKDKKWHIQEA